MSVKKYEDIDKGMAFIEINYLFNSIEYKDLDNGIRLDKLRHILDRLEKTAYDGGLSRGIDKCIQNLQQSKSELFK